MENQQPIIPDHELFRRIGDGSYGQVWLARNTLGAFRAVKVIFRSSFDNSRPFEREWAGIKQFEPVSRSHEGLIDVLQVGINEGYFYYVMELGDDAATGQIFSPGDYTPKTLATEIKVRGRLPVQNCLDLGLALSQALAELHKHGLVHRDVKPSNIIFVNGVPKLADIGLVARVGNARSYVGTEGFMPPEGPGSPQADVFSLGRVLYEASTGKDRHDFPSLPEAVRDFPDHDRFLELNDVILKACDVDTGHRYGSALEMNSDLSLVSNGKSLKRLRLLERRWETLKRITRVGGAVVVIAALLAYNFYRSFRDAADAKQRKVGGDTAYGNRALDSGDLMGSLPYFTDVLRVEGSDPVASHADRLRIGSILAQCPKLTRLWSEGQQVKFGEFSPDGTKALIALYGGNAPALLYKLEGAKAMPSSLGPSTWLTSASFSKDGRIIATSSEGGTVSLWDTETARFIATLPQLQAAQSVRFSPDGSRVIASCLDGIARVWNLRNQKVEYELPHGAPLWFADFSPDGHWIATAGEDKTARIWTSEGKLKKVLNHSGWVYYASFSPDSKMIVTACSDHFAYVWTVSGDPILPALEHDDVVKSAEFSPDGKLIVTASFDRTARLWSTKTHAPIPVNPILRQGEPATHASFSPDARMVMVTGYEGTVRIWDLAGQRTPPPPQRCTISDDGSRLAQFSGHTVRLTATSTGQTTEVSVGSDLIVEGVNLNRNGRFAVIIDRETSPSRYKCRILDCDVAREIGPPFSIASSNDNVVIDDFGKEAAVYGDHSLELIDVATGTKVGKTMTEPQKIDLAVFNPVSDELAVQTSTNLIIIAARTGDTKSIPMDFPAPLSYAEFSPDGRFIVVSSRDDQLTKCSAQVFDVQTGNRIGPALHHEDGVTVSRFSPDSAHVATASEDHTALIWDFRNGKRLVNPIHHKGEVRDVVFSSDGHFMATAGTDDTTRIWSALTGDPLSPAFRDFSHVLKVRLFSDCSRVFTENEYGECRVWKLDYDARDVKDLSCLADLLFGSSPSSASSGNGSSAPQEATWHRLQNSYPSTFAVSTQDILDWHEFVAEESETNQDWFAAAFHLNLLLADKLERPDLRGRLAAATRRINEAH